MQGHRVHARTLSTVGQLCHASAVEHYVFEQQMRTPGVEPGSQAWEACMMPLHYMRLRFVSLVLCTKISAHLTPRR